MRNVIVSEFLTLDGVMQAPGGRDEDPSGGFEHGGWQMRYMDEERGAAITEGLAGSGGLLLGRTTYQIFAAYWPNAPESDPIADIVNGLHKYVASTTLTEPLEWQNSTLLEGDAADGVAKLKAQPGDDLLVIGSGGLARTLMQHGLVDRYELMIHPLVVGRGKRLFREDGGMIALRLLDVSSTSTGVLVATYEPADRTSEGSRA